MATLISYTGKTPPIMRVAVIYHMVPTHGTGGGGSLPVPVAGALKGGTVGTAYSETISAQGGTTPYTFAATGGTLPTGTSLNSSTGVISGTPTTAGTFSFTVSVTDVNLNVGSQAFTIIIAAPSPSANYGYTA